MSAFFLLKISSAPSPACSPITLTTQFGLASAASSNPTLSSFLDNEEISRRCKRSAGFN
jgi:hypothetical protein